VITDEEHRIGDLLRAVELPRSNVDLARAITSGRRRRRRRGVVAVAAATVLVTAVGIGAVAVRRDVAGSARLVAAANCVTTVLPNLPGHFTRAVYAIDPTGRYTVGISRLVPKPEPGVTPSPGWEYNLVRWDGAAEPVGVWPMYTETPSIGPLAVRPDGTVLVTSDHDSTSLIVRPNGRTVVLEARATAETRSNARYVSPSWTTPAGQIGGWILTVYPTSVYAAVTWAEGPDEPGRRPDTLVPVPGFQPLATGATGVTVGIRRNPDRYVVRHPDGRERDLALPAGLAPDGVSQVTGDWAVGVTSDRTQVRWNLTTGAVDRIDGAAGVTPGVSVDGSVAYSDADGRAMVRAPDGRVRTLPVPTGREIVDLLRMSDDGRTVLGALRVPATTDAPEAVEAVRWTC
jgi:hypothetical protein